MVEPNANEEVVEETQKALGLKNAKGLMASLLIKQGLHPIISGLNLIPGDRWPQVMD